MAFIKEEITKLGNFTSDEKKVAVVFGITVLLWTLSPFVSALGFIPGQVGEFFLTISMMPPFPYLVLSYYSFFLVREKVSVCSNGQI